MRVALRRGERRMPEQLLDRPQVRAAVQEMGRAGVAQCVRMQIATSGPPPAVVAHERLDRARADASSAHGDEERRTVERSRPGMRERRTAREVVDERSRAFSSERYDAFL